MKRKLYVFCVILAVAGSLMAGCGPQSGGETPQGTELVPQTTATVAPSPTATRYPVKPSATIAPPKNEEITRVVFWHGLGGDIGGQVIPALVGAFDGAQEQCYVEPRYMGGGDAVFQALKQGSDVENRPMIAQLSDVFTRQMYDLQGFTAVQDYVDQEKYDLSDFEAAMLSSYTIDGRLVAMPFNSSSVILYYNKKLFQEAGLDPQKPPRTFDEVSAYARKLTKKDADGKVLVSGLSISVYGWFFEQLLAGSGGQFVDQGNGRDALATQATFNGLEGVKVLDWWKTMQAEGLLGAYGRKNADVRAAFSAGKTAMFIDSSAIAPVVVDATQGQFEVGSGPLPRPTEAVYQSAGPLVGGGALWILNGGEQEEQDCAWAFVKFLAQPQQQATWQARSGYFAVRKSAAGDAVASEWMKRYGLFQVAVDQLHAAPNTRVTQGVLIGPVVEARLAVEDAIEAALSGKVLSQDALDEAATKVTQAIEEYNLSMGLNQ